MLGRPRSRPRGFSVAREEVRRAWLELRGPRSTPGRAAASAAVGTFIGSIPIFGLHTPIVLALSLWLRLDGALAFLAANVSNPLFAPALLTAEAQTGSWLRTGAPLHVGGSAWSAAALRHVVADTFLGAPLIGLILAALAAALAWAVVAVSPDRAARPPYRLPPDAPPFLVTVERVATRYASPTSASPLERTRFHYLRAKLTTDPLAKLVAGLAADLPGGLGALLDVGCGRGQVSLLLLELGCASSSRGIDWDESKVATGRRAAGAHDGMPALAASFACGDARTEAYEPADTVLLVDILHYFSAPEQDALLERAAAAVRPGGRLVVREADTERGWRSALTWLEESFFTRVRWNRGERVAFRPARAIVARLEASGLRCEVRPAWGATPFSNVLVVGGRAG
ncbi:MAG: DUF2062 domain-containing protein [Myxococcales bacterium]|nr:DUF2062 domain-containing protein [Myxococcales bacterium]